MDRNKGLHSCMSFACFIAYFKGIINLYRFILLQFEFDTMMKSYINSNVNGNVHNVFICWAVSKTWFNYICTGFACFIAYFKGIINIYRFILLQFNFDTMMKSYINSNVNGNVHNVFICWAVSILYCYNKQTDLLYFWFAKSCFKWKDIGVLIDLVSISTR